MCIRDSVNLELGVDLPLHLVYSLEQLFQALGGQILRLDGDGRTQAARDGQDERYVRDAVQRLR